MPNQEIKQQLNDAVFHNRYPTVELKPFATKVWRHGPLTDVGITTKLRPWPDDVIKAPSFSLKRFEFLAEAFDTSVECIQHLPSAVLFELQSNLAAETNTWLTEAFDELPEWTESGESVVQWEIMKSVGANTILPMPLTGLQRSWIMLSRNRERKENADMWTALLDRLYPWLNFNMWNDIKRAEDARQNVEYNTDHEAFMSGQAPDEDDLDEIRVIGST